MHLITQHLDMNTSPVNGAGGRAAPHERENFRRSLELAMFLLASDQGARPGAAVT
jgi:hypothetical protein